MDNAASPCYEHTVALAIAGDLSHPHQRLSYLPGWTAAYEYSYCTSPGTVLYELPPGTRTGTSTVRDLSDDEQQQRIILPPRSVSPPYSYSYSYQG